MNAKQPGAGFRRGTVPAGEFTLDYAEAGPPDGGVTVVSLPASAGLEMSTAKDILAREHRVIEINPPGWGGKDDLSRPMHQREIGALLAEAIDRLVNGDFYLLGTALGGGNALYVAAELRHRVRGIILDAPMAPVRPEDMRMPSPDPAGQDFDPDKLPLPPFDPRKPWATEDFLARQMRYRFAMFRQLETDHYPESALAAVNEQDIPVLALLGTHDEFLKPSQEQTIAVALPKATFHLVPDGTHDLQNIVPEQFVAEVRQFIGGDTAQRNAT